ncbi:MAG: hypothetical protein JST82_02965 [Bacteroidetes bacterium]|nr:hypothetical protein [Bacteroidota bacterium]
MKWMILIMFLVLGGIAYSQPGQVPVRRLDNYYYIGTRLNLKNDVNCFVVTTRREFTRFFGETVRPDTPDFSKEVMLILLMPSSDRNTKLSFDKISMKAGGFLEVYCNVKTDKHKMPYKLAPIEVAVVPRFKETKNVNFYNLKHMDLMASVLVK